jgi:hypothetical protein
MRTLSPLFEMVRKRRGVRLVPLLTLTLHRDRYATSPENLVLRLSDRTLNGFAGYDWLPAVIQWGGPLGSEHGFQAPSINPLGSSIRVSLKQRMGGVASLLHLVRYGSNSSGYEIENADVLVQLGVLSGGSPDLVTICRARLTKLVASQEDVTLQITGLEQALDPEDGATTLLQESFRASVTTGSTVVPGEDDTERPTSVVAFTVATLPTLMMAPGIYRTGACGILSSTPQVPPYTADVRIRLAYAYVRSLVDFPGTTLTVTDISAFSQGIHLFDRISACGVAAGVGSLGQITGAASVDVYEITSELTQVEAATWTMFTNPPPLGSLLGSFSGSGPYTINGVGSVRGFAFVPAPTPTAGNAHLQWAGTNGLLVVSFT